MKYWNARTLTSWIRDGRARPLFTGQVSTRRTLQRSPWIFSSAPWLLSGTRKEIINRNNWSSTSLNKCRVRLKWSQTCRFIILRCTRTRTMVRRTEWYSNLSSSPYPNCLISNRMSLRGWSPICNKPSRIMSPRATLGSIAWSNGQLLSLNNRKSCRRSRL